MSKNITWTAGAMSALTLVLTCKNIACATQSILVVTQMGRCAVLYCVALYCTVTLCLTVGTQMGRCYTHESSA